MRIVEKLLYGIGGLLALILLFIAFCHYNPNVAQEIGETIQSGGNAPVKTVAKPKPKPTFQGNTGVPTEEAALEELSIGPVPRDPIVVSATVTTQALPEAAAASAAKTSEPEEDLDIPEKVAGLAGYVPVRATGTEVTQKRAEEILDSLSPGKTGEGLTFDSEKYPYYEMLGDTQKAIYRQIYANADAMTKQFSPVENITSGDLKNAFTAVVNDHPELFWVETAYKYRHSPAGQVAEITLAYNITAGNLDKAKSDFQAAAKEITDTVYGIYTAYDREKKIHDELISRVKYDTNAPMNQSAYSALVYGRTVCAGYARALQYLLQQFDIPCYYVTGYAGENHAWNIVKLDDGYYNVDSTWDDTNPNTYDYFNCSDDEYAKDHARRDLSVYLPPCKGNRYSGLEVNPPAQQPSKPTTTPPTSAPSTSTPSTPSTPPSTTPPSTTTPSTTTPSTTPSGSTSSSATVPSTAPSGTTGRGSITVRTTRNGSDAGYIDNIEDYYIACFEAMMAQDGSSATFDVLISDEDLWKDIYNEYQNGKCQDGYMERFLVEKHKNNCTVSVEAYLRNDGSCLIRHYATIN